MIWVSPEITDILGEDFREVISAYQKCAAETIQRFGGFVAKYMGDGVLVYFGYPQAHEDDAERSASQRDWWLSAIDRLRRFAAAGNRRRDAEPRSATAGHCGAEQRRDC
jgi:class 3 adenylate cyclase